MLAVDFADVRGEIAVFLGCTLGFESASVPPMPILEKRGVRLFAVLSFGVLLRSLLMPSMSGHARLLSPLRNRRRRCRI